MKNIYFLLFSLLLTACLFDSNQKQVFEDEKLIYSAIIDSVFNKSYEIVFIEDSSRSINRYIQKNLFSESLFGQEINAYYKSFLKKKQCETNNDLLATFIDNNRKNYSLSDKYVPQRNYKYVTYSSIYYYINGLRQKNNELTQTKKKGIRFGIISFSRVAFNNDKTEAFLEVNIYRVQKGEVFFANLRKLNGEWKFSSNCYMYGPYRINQ